MNRVRRAVPRRVGCVQSIRCLVLVLIVTSVGDWREQTMLFAQSIESGYGRQSGSGYAQSINGTAVFAELFRQSGKRVRHEQYLSAAVDRFDVVVWFPDDFEAPRPHVTARLNRWLHERQGRTLLYVGRDYDSGTDFWNAVAGTVPGPSAKREAYRQAALAQSSHRNREARPLDQSKCDWFTIERRAIPLKSEASGSWASGMPQRFETLGWGKSRLVPNSQQALFQLDEVFLLDEQPFVFSWGKSGSTSRVVVVNNGSFLLNYPLTFPDNRTLAHRLIEMVGDGSQVWFLESGPADPLFNDSGGGATSWSWIAQRPLSYIVPHLIALGIIALFHFFPILGRPRLGLRPRTNRFGRHIQAIGAMLERSRDISAARDIVQQYRKRIGKEAS